MSANFETSSIDVAVTFFASILILYVFVTLASAPATPDTPRSTTGQRQKTVDAVPPTWDAVRERTSFAFLSGGTLRFLEMDHFVGSVQSPLNWVRLPDHEESTSLDEREPSPNAFGLTLRVRNGDLPVEWVRAEISVSPVGETLDQRCEPLRPGSGGVRRLPLTTVLVDPRPSTRFAEFLELAHQCDLRHRLLVLPFPSKADGQLAFTIRLDRAQFSLETTFR